MFVAVDRRLIFRLLVAAAAGCASICDASAQLLNQNMLFTSIQPCRVVDTRVAGGRFSAGEGRIYQVAGRASFSVYGGNPAGCPIPGELGVDIAEVQALFLNLVAVAPDAPGHLEAWPTDQNPPGTSVLNFIPGETIANGVIVPVGQGNGFVGDISVLAAASGTHLVVDVLGFFTMGGRNFNTFLGIFAGNPTQSLVTNQAGSENTAVGYEALASLAPMLSLPTANSAFGVASLGALQTGNANTAVGESALAGLSSGGANTAIGERALLLLASGSQNISVGAGAGEFYAGGESNNIVIGNGGTAGESNVIRIGSTQTAVFITGIVGASSSGGVPVLVNGSGQLGTMTSSLRFKENIADMGDTTDRLMELRPVRFNYKEGFDDGSHLVQYGLVAEEVAKIYPDLVQYDEDGKPLAVKYHFVNAMLLNEVQKQHREIAAQLALIASQKDQIQALEAAGAEQLRQAAEIQNRLERLEQEVHQLRLNPAAADRP
jgi:polyhydroxyalkanoate synthesis regulator phasin